MEWHDKNPDIENVELSLPVNAAYVSAARQTAASITGRLGFDADEIEDVKMAVSEACAYFIKALDYCGHQSYKLCFGLRQDYVEVSLSCAAVNPAFDRDDYGLVLIKNLMEGFGVTQNGGVFTLVMAKRHKDSGLL